MDAGVGSAAVKRLDAAASMEILKKRVEIASIDATRDYFPLETVVSEKISDPRCAIQRP